MEIIIGSMPPLGTSGAQEKGRNNNIVEAQVLHVRPPRRGISGPSGAERRGKTTSDPVKGRVITLMVADGDNLPKDIETANYKVTMRFQRTK